MWTPALTAPPMSGVLENCQEKQSEAKIGGEILACAWGFTQSSPLYSRHWFHHGGFYSKQLWDTGGTPGGDPPPSLMLILVCRVFGPLSIKSLRWFIFRLWQREILNSVLRASQAITCVCDWSDGTSVASTKRVTFKRTTNLCVALSKDHK